MSWLRNKIQERKDKDVERRSRTPERSHERNKSRQDLHSPPEENLPVRGKSIEQTRGFAEGPTEITATSGTASTAEQARLDEAGANGEERKADNSGLETRPHTGTEPNS